LLKEEEALAALQVHKAKAALLETEVDNSKDTVRPTVNGTKRRFSDTGEALVSSTTSHFEETNFR